VTAGDAAGPLAGGGDLRHGQRGSVAGEDAVLADDVFQGAEQVALGLQLLDDGLDDDLTGREGFQGGGRLDPGRCGIGCVLRDPALQRQPGQRRGDGAPRLDGGPRREIEEQDANAGLGGDLRDAAPHGAGAGDAERQVGGLDVGCHVGRIGGHGSISHD